MELRVLKYFMAVAQEESISAATEVLHVTQPTLSRQLMDLEYELGKQLFVRGSRKIALTEEDKILRRRGEEILGLVNRAESEIKAADETIAGDIYIGAGEMDSISYITAAMKSIHQKYPDVVFHISSGDSGDLTDKLDSGIIDFAVLANPFSGDKYNYVPLPVKESWGVLMRKDSELAQKSAVKPEDLWEQPLIISRHALESGAVKLWFRKETSRLNIIGTYNLIFNGAQMVKQGLGYALTLDKLINVTGDSELTFRPLEPKLELNFFVTWKKNSSFSRTVRVFFEEIQSLIGGE